MKTVNVTVMTLNTCKLPFSIAFGFATRHWGIKVVIVVYLASSDTNEFLNVISHICQAITGDHNATGESGRKMIEDKSKAKHKQSERW